jgi:hypothetical protein
MPGGSSLPTRRTKYGQAVQIPTRGLIVVSWSEIDAARQCPMKHDLSYIERWSKPPRPDGALARGTLWHNVLEEHYRVLASTQGAKPGDKPTGTDKDRMKAARKAVAKVLFEAEQAAGSNSSALETVNLITWMYEGYVELYGLDPNWWIAATEHAAQVRLPNLAGKPSRFALKLKIDLVIAVRPGIMTKTPNWKTYVVDHKSGKDLPRDKDFDLMDQFSLYTWSLRKMGRKVFGQMYSAARTFRSVNDQSGKSIDPLDKRFSRTPMHRTDTELERVAVEAYQTVAARYRQQIEVDRAGAEPPRHTNEQTCSWRCDFTEPCLHGRKGGDMRDFLRSTGFIQSFERH